ncbi:MAG: hypothetical protein PHX30_05140 [Candidatus Pacebacteria bacterium]|nr:hypothetical protein [Candidatus Paceibacterota bacterium]
MKTEEPKFISLAAAAKMTNYSQDYISLLCRQGKLKAEKLGRNWVTTKEWLYEYVDKTEGKGASIVPVRIKEVDEKATDKKTSEKKKEDVGEKKPAVRPLFGSTVLELSVFCTVSVILLANIVGFSRGVREVNKNSGVVQDFTVVQNSAATERAESGDMANVTGAEKAVNDPVNNIAAESMCGGEAGLPELVAFDKETDTAAIAAVTAEIEAGITEPVTVEVYKDFAIVSYKSAPETDYLYMLK